MSSKYDFDSKVHIALNLDEAVVLLTYLAREIWNLGEERLQPSLEHEAEAHSLEALLQELAARLIDTGGSDADAIHEFAVKHLMGRFV